MLLGIFFVYIFKASLMILNWYKRTSCQVAAVLCVHFGCLRNTFMTLEPESDNIFGLVVVCAALETSNRYKYSNEWGGGEL